MQTQTKKTLGELLKDNDERDSDQEYEGYLGFKNKKETDYQPSNLRYNNKRSSFNLRSKSRLTLSNPNPVDNEETIDLNSILDESNNSKTEPNKQYNRKSVNFDNTNKKNKKQHSNFIVDFDIIKDKDSILLKDLNTNIQETSRHVELVKSVFSSIDESTVNQDIVVTKKKSCLNTAIVYALIISIILILLSVFICGFLYKKADKENIRRTSLFCGLGILVFFLVSFSLIIYACITCSK